ncbi:MAG: GNAT family N-acetyltransferase, partial [Acidimicrobiia bacterium]|nr:GNAT family N-acetyltransferase [Acidimicrobiia bacterium]
MTGDQQREWADALDRVGLEGGYHSLGYHRLGQANGEGTPRLARYTEGAHVILLPFLMRPLDDCVPEAEGWDATSVYGYAGPLTTTPTPPADVLERFRRALSAELRRAQVISLFTRLDPLQEEQRAVVDGLGAVAEMGPVVVIDLTQHEDAQHAGYGRSTRRHVRRGAAEGFTCVEDRGLVHLPVVVDLYLATMSRTGAAARYHHQLRYFERMMEELGGAARLFVCLRGDDVLSGSVYLVEGPHVHAHLGGSVRQPGTPSPGTFETDRVRRWASAQGHRWLNLGGGVGSRDDSLLEYKLGFSKTTLPFRTWRWVIDEAR